MTMVKRQGDARERGAISTIVVTLLAAGVLLGFVALSVDLGRTVLERRELQNAADAGALALGQRYARGDTLDQGALQSLVNSNAGDGDHKIELLCGSPDTGLSACPPGDVERLSECPPLQASQVGVSHVEVHTRTRSGSAEEIDNVFGAVIPGGEATSTVDACARVLWGPPISGSTIPFTISQCEWETFTQNGTVFNVDTALPVQYKKDAPCEHAPSGGDFPGAFGHLVHSGCLATIDVGSWQVTSNKGNGKFNECKDKLQPLPKVVHFPVFDDFKDDEYHIVGFAAFEVTGWDYTGPKEGVRPAQSVCDALSKNGHCIFGRWVKDMAPPSDFVPGPGGADLGLTIIQMAG